MRDSAVLLFSLGDTASFLHSGLHGNKKIASDISKDTFEIPVVDIDAVSYYWRHPFKILSQDKQRKNVKYIEACLER